MQFVEVDARNRVVHERPGARGGHAAGRAAALHEHRPRPAGVHPLALRRLARRRPWSRWSRRRAKCSRCTARRRSTRIGSVGGVSHVVLRLAAHRSAPAALQQGAPGQSIRRVRRSSSRRRSWRSRTASSPSIRTCRSRARGFYYFGNRAWQCWEKEGHGSLDLLGAIAQSCDVYFYQLGPEAHARRASSPAASGSVSTSGRASICPRRSKPSFPTSVPGLLQPEVRAARLDAGRERAEPGDRAG